MTLYLTIFALYNKIRKESRSYMKRYLKEHYKNLILLSILSIAVMLFVGRDTTIQGHDMGFHVWNTENLAAELDPLQGKIYAPDITKGSANNLGYGLYIFYPPLPHVVYAYGTKFLSVFHINTVDSIYIMNILVTLLSVYLIYILSFKVSKNKKIALLAGIIFLLFPYRLANIFVRYSINEAFTFLFIPLILLGLIYLKDHDYKKFYPTFIVGYIGLLSSHLVISLYFTLLLIPFAIFYRKEIFDKKTIGVICKATLFVSLFVLPSIVQMLQHQSNGYLVFADGYMTSKDLVAGQAMNLNSYLFLDRNDWNVPLFIPNVVLILFGISIFLILKNRKKEKEFTFYGFLLCMTLLAFFMTLKIFPWKHMPDLFILIQFPWRLETILTVTISLIAPYFLVKLDYKYITIPFVILLCISLVPYMDWLRNRSYHVEAGQIDDTYATGNIDEYYPVEYALSKDYYKKRKQDIVFIEGEADIKIEKSTFPTFTFTVTNNKDAVVEIPRLYYLGYELTVNGEPYTISRSARGMIRQKITEEGTYQLVYKGTILKQCLNGIKYIYLVLVVAYFLRKRFIK